MNARLIIDKAGDSLEMESTGQQITLRPVRGTSPLTKEHGVWVLRSGQSLPASAADEMLAANPRRARRGQLGFPDR